MLSIANTSLHKSPALMRGSSLIEVLVSVLVLTLGLLSMISMHTASITFGKQAEFRSTASQLAQDYADRMRANTTGVVNGNYTRLVAWTETPAKVTDPGVSCTPITCTTNQIAEQIAASDQAQWNNAAIAMLPGAGLHVAAVGGSVMDIWVMWQEPGTDTQDAAQNTTLADAFACPAAAKAGPKVRCLFYRVAV